MASYWLISAPGEPTKEQTWQKLNSRTLEYSTNYKLQVPELRVGTLDSLLELSDDLTKIDTYVESVSHKIERQLQDLNPEESLSVNGVNVDTFITKFRWDEAKHPLKNSLRELTTAISEDVSKIDEELKVKSTEYMNLKSALAAIKRKAAGSLMVKSLSDVVDKSDIVDSENLATLFIVVPKFLSKDFVAGYETLTDFVVPRSAKKLAEDNEYELYRVIVFKRVAEDYKNACRDKRYNVREFAFDAESLEASKGEKFKLEREVEREWASLVRYSRAVFSEVFAAWMHLKAIRIFVESVLRYGLPANFIAIIMKPIKRTYDKKIRDVLGQLYGHLGGASFSTDPDAAPGQEFYPYVYLPLNPETIPV